MTINNQKKEGFSCKASRSRGVIEKLFIFLRSTLELVCSLFLVFPIGLDHTRNWDFDRFRSDRIREIGIH